MFRLVALLALLFVVTIACARADDVAYKCTDRTGQISYQATPCTKTQRQEKLDLPATPPAPLVSPSVAATTTAPAAANAAVAPPPAPPAAPVPTMYRCVRATDGKTYLSNTGEPSPYLAPLGMLGVVPVSLADIYSAANHMGHAQPNAAMVASHYTWVQDQCRELSPQETCQTLRDAYDVNEHKLSRAFKSDQPPLLKREAELRAQLQGCGGP